MGHIFEIKDPDIDAESIEKKVIERLASREQVEGPDPFVPQFKTPAVGGNDAATWDPELAFEVGQATKAHDSAWVSVQSTGSRLPFFGQLVSRFKRELHGLSAFYTNLYASKQVSFNAHTARALARLSGLVAGKADTAEVERLKRDVKALSDRVFDLEARLVEVEGVERGAPGSRADANAAAHDDSVSTSANSGLSDGA